MADQKLISFDLRADFGFFKKPDYNDGILLSYNMIHKPALLGILGAIIGLNGYSKKGEFPEYYQRLKDLHVGIEPLNHEKGNFQKTTVKYSNTVGYANDDGNLLIEEMMLVKPAYRCYVLLDLAIEDQKKLYDYLKIGQAEYIPYLGKNEFQATWLNKDGESTFREYTFEIRQRQSGKVKLVTLFQKGSMIVKENVDDEDSIEDYNPFEIVLTPEMFMYFERLPIGFVSQQLIQYDLQSHVYSSFSLKDEVTLPGLYFLKEIDSYAQLT